MTLEGDAASSSKRGAQERTQATARPGNWWDNSEGGDLVSCAGNSGRTGGDEERAEMDLVSRGPRDWDERGVTLAES